MPAEDELQAAAEQPADQDTSTAEVSFEVPGEPAPQRRRTRGRLLTGAILGILVAVVVVLGVALLGSGDDKPAAEAAPWSAWKPSASGDGATAQIAGHVGRRYRESDGSALVRVQGGPLEVDGLPLTVAVRSGAELTRFGGESVLYRLCGLGRDCAISAAKPSVERHLLLRREALELVLYSLRYRDDVDQVVVLMPPRRGNQPGQALFVRREQVASELQKPLDATLVDRAPSIARVYKSPDAGLVQRITLPTLFRYSLTPADPGDDALLVLEPFSSNAPQPAPGTPGLPGSSRS